MFQKRWPIMMDEIDQQAFNMGSILILSKAKKLSVNVECLHETCVKFFKGAYGKLYILAVPFFYIATSLIFMQVYN